MTTELLVSIDRDSLRLLRLEAKDMFCLDHQGRGDFCSSCGRHKPSPAMRRAIKDADRAIESWRDDPMRKLDRKRGQA